MNFLPVNQAGIPDALKQRGWANWIAEPRKGHPGKWSKAPCDPMCLRKISVNDVGRLRSFELAMSHTEKGKATGVGVVLDGDGLVGIDIDNFDSKEQQVQEFLERCVDRSIGSPPYIEQSPSGHGLRIFLLGKLPPDAPSRRGSLEIYQDKRFLTVTGQLHPDYSSADYLIGPRQDLIDDFLRLLGYSPQQAVHNEEAASAENKVEPSVASPVESLCVYANQKAPELWRGDWRATGKYPSQSEADYAVLGALVKRALDIGVRQEGIAEVVESAFARSGLHRQEKADAIKKHAIPKLLHGHLLQNQTKQKVTALDDMDKKDPLAGLLALTLEEEDVRQMSEAKFLVPNMIVKGHVHAFIAPGNGGKTTIFTYLCEQLSASGNDVFYLNVDGSASDLKRHFSHAKTHGYSVIAPDAKLGKSIADVIEVLETMAQSNVDLSDRVLIFDVLKKFVNVIEKRESRWFYQLLRSLSVKGATICLLGHTNKYNDKDGKPIFEGTADLRNDVDDLLYLDVFRDVSKNRLEVTTRPDKVRAQFQPRSFEILLGENRRVVESGVVFTTENKEQEALIERIRDAIKSGLSTQKDIVAYVRQYTDHGDKWIKQFLKQQTGPNGSFEVKQAGRGRDLHYSLPTPIEDYPF